MRATDQTIQGRTRQEIHRLCPQRGGRRQGRLREAHLQPALPGRAAYVLRLHRLRGGLAGRPLGYRLHGRVEGMILRRGLHGSELPRMTLPAEPRRPKRHRPGHLLHAGDRSAVTADHHSPREDSHDRMGERERRSELSTLLPAQRDNGSGDHRREAHVLQLYRLGWRTRCRRAHPVMIA